MFPEPERLGQGELHRLGTMIAERKQVLMNSPVQRTKRRMKNFMRKIGSRVARRGRQAVSAGKAR
jgi:diphthamide synthase subunit DPH2